jgi:hypothetical protein
MGPSHVFHRYIKGVGDFGVSRLSSFNVGRVGLVGRAVVGACSWSMWGRNIWRVRESMFLDANVDSNFGKLGSVVAK